MDAALFPEWRRLAAAGLNNRAIAAQLGVSEARLVSSGLGTVSWPLVADSRRILEAAALLGPVKWVVRNDDAVLERPGTVQEVAVSANRLVARGDTFELQLSPGAIAIAFALVESTSRGTKRSMQLFDAAGTTLVKIVLRPESSLEAFDRLIETLEGGASVLDTASSRKSDCPALLPGRLAEFLHEAVRVGASLRWVVQNSGARLEATTAIHRVKRSDHVPWINVLDPQLDLHLHERALTRIAAEGQWLHWHGDSARAALSVECTGAFISLAKAANGLPAVSTQV